MEIRTKPLPVCPCGTTRESDNIEEHPEYTLWGWICISIIGVTPRPDHIVFRCPKCGMNLGVTRDPALLHKRRNPAAP